MVTTASRSIWLVLEALAPMPSERLRAAGVQLTGVIEALCPNARIEIAVLNTTAPCLSRAVERN